MATADELLTDVVNVDRTLIVDNSFRTIRIPPSVTNLGVEHDDDVLVLDFKMPRYICNTDLSTFSIRINYINAGGESDIYFVEESTVDDQYITFSWLVGPIATRYSGNTQFNICAKNLKDNAKEFNTTPTSLPVLAGLEVDEGTITEYPDILEQWRRELFGISNTEEATIKAISAAEQTAIKVVSAAEQTAIENKGAEVLATIPEEYTTTVRGIINKLTPSFTESGAIVTCEPVEGHPLEVNSAIIPVQSGSGDPSPDNVRPISGHSAVKLTRCGKNLLAYPYTGISANGTKKVQGITYKDNGDGSITINGTSGAISFLNLATNIYLGDTVIDATGSPSGKSNGVYAISKWLYYSPIDKILRVNILKGTEVNNVTIYPQAELGTIETAYEPYRGEEFTADFGQTVYGGSYDWSSGELTITNGVYTWDNNTDVVQYTSNGELKDSYFIRRGLPDMKIGFRMEGMCNNLPVIRTLDDEKKPGIRLGGNNNYPYLINPSMLNESIVDVDSLKAYLAEHPITFTYPLAEPVTIQLTPQEILALSKVNTLCCDTGDITVTGNSDPIAIIDELANAINTPGGGGEDAVLYTQQTLDEEQQAQARENIGAASAEAESTVKMIAEGFEFAVVSANKFDNVYDADGGINPNTGEDEIHSERIRSSNYYPIGIGDDIFFAKQGTVGSDSAHVMLYDENKVFIKCAFIGESLTISNGNGTNVKYIRVSVRKDADCKLYVSKMHPGYNVETVDYTYKKAIIRNSVLYTDQNLTKEQQEQARVNIGAADVDEVEKLTSRMQNVENTMLPYFPLFKFKQGTIQKTTPLTYEYSELALRIRVCTDPVRVSSNLVVKARDGYSFDVFELEMTNGVYNSTNRIASSWKKEITVETAPNLFYAVVVKADNGSDIFCEDVRFYLDMAYANASEDEEFEKPYKPYNVLVIGDSITEKNSTADTNWVDIVSANITFHNVKNVGMSGTGIVRPYNTSPCWYDKVDTLASNFDLILIMGNMNDFSDPAYFNTDTIGVFGDNTLETQYGAVKLFLDKLFTKYPLARIGWITSTPRQYQGSGSAPYQDGYLWGKNSVFESANKAIIEVCEHYSIPVLDLFHGSNLRPWDTTQRTTYFSGADGVHPNNTGHAIIAPKIIDFINRNF